MRIRSLGLVAFAGLSIALSACSSGSGASGSAAAAAPSATPDPCAGAAKHSGDARTLPTDKSQTKIGVAADVGKIDDKNFNEYTYKGATDAATALGSAKTAGRTSPCPRFSIAVPIRRC